MKPESPAPAARAPQRASARPGAPARVMSAARKDRAVEARGGPLGTRLKSEAENTALNFLARATEALESFRRSDRFFKYKAGIVTAWFLVSVLTLLWAPPSSSGGDNRLGATLVVTTVLDHPVYMVRNDSSRTWREVVVVVNKSYRAAVAEVEAGQNLTLGPKQLLGENGSVAPINLELQDFEIRTSDGSARLMEAGHSR